MHLSIRYKILAVLGLLLLFAVGVYTLLASRIFIQEKKALLYDLNHSLATNASSQVKTALDLTSNQIRMYVLSQVVTGENNKVLKASFLQQAHITGLVLFEQNNGNFTPKKLSGETPRVSLEPSALIQYLKTIQQENLSFWTTTAEEQSPRFFLGLKLDFEIEKNLKTYLAIAEIDASQVFEPIQASSLFQAHLVREDGTILVSIKNQSLVFPKEKNPHPLLNNARSDTSGVLEFRDQGEDWLGAYSPVGTAKLFWVSQAERSQISSATTVLVQRSLLFGLIVATLTFLASILFSRKLTLNLYRLTESANRIGSGDLNQEVKIHSGDEIEQLSRAFNQMREALKTSREAIERYNRELEDKVQLRTKQLQDSNAAIKEVQEKLLRSTHLAAVGEVAGRTAHELLNPLTAIVSRLERSKSLLTHDGQEEDANQQLSQISQSWRDEYKQGGISQLTKSLQEKSKVHPGKILLEEDLENLETIGKFWNNQVKTVSNDLQFVFDQATRIQRIVDRMREYVRASDKEKVHSHKAIEEACQTMADYLAQNGVQLKTDFKATDDLADMNRDEFIQILTNLIRNSMQSILATGKKGVIELKSGSEGPLFWVDVIDNGGGISEENIPKLFDQGFTTKPPSEGTGLGLSICRRYARSFGGEVELLYSEPSTRGTCFRVLVPLALHSLAS